MRGENVEVIKTPLGFEGIEYFSEYDVYLYLRKVRESGEHIVGDIQIKALSGGKQYSLYFGRFNVTSANSRKQTARYIAELVEGSVFAKTDWAVLLEKFAQEVYKKIYEPKEALPLEPLEEHPEVPFLLYPLLPERVPVLLYAPGGVGKSLIALYIAILLQSGYDLHYNKRDPVNVLYVDWELDRELMNIRFNQIVPEELEEKKAPLYMQATHTLADEIADILVHVREKDVKLVILDSAGMAIGGDINDATAVIRFYQEVRKITEMGATVLILTHVAKSQKSQDDETTPIGSAFFEYLARMTWELKYWKHPAFESAYVHALYNRKSNFGKKDPVAFRVRWRDGLAFIELTDVETEGAITGVTQADTVLMALRENGPLSLNDLAQITGINKQSLKVLLSRMKREGLLQNDGQGFWRSVR